MQTVSIGKQVCIEKLFSLKPLYIVYNTFKDNKISVNQVFKKSVLKKCFYAHLCWCEKFSNKRKYVE